MKKLLYILSIIIFIFGCNKREEQPIAAQVNDEILTIEKLQSGFSEQQWNLKSNAEKKQLVQDWIDLTVLAQAADREEISATPEVSFRIENSIKSIKANSLIAQRLSSIEITENDLFNYYKLHQNRYEKTKKEYKVQQIYTNDFETNKLVLEAIKNGMQFTDAAKTYSQEKAGKKGGYIGFVGKEDVEKVVWKKLTKLKKWHYDTVNTAKGFYIVRYYQTRNVKINKKFIEVKDEIRTKVLKEKQNQLYNQLVEEVKNQTEKIIISI
ncbi:MAG: peptidylprolyl isomerase [Candidatus Cloacimonetes bacterium]|nr:peptidylprolyl isomerase [Candidatus Cloacimonadota bacterium]